MKTTYGGEKIDISRYLDEVDLTIIPTEKDIESEMVKALVKAHITFEPVGNNPIETGDTVKLCTKSDIPKFNKPEVTVTVGRGLYSKDIETAVIGKKAGDEFAVEINGQAVAVSVISAKRKVLPKPTDEMVAEQEIEGVTTIEQFRKVFAEQYEDSVYGPVVGGILQKLVEQAELPEPYDEDIDILGKLEARFFRELFKAQDGIDLDTLSPEQLKEKLGCGSMEEFVIGRHDWYKMKVKQCLVLSEVLDIPLTGEFNPTEDYHVLGKLTMKFMEYIKTELKRRKENGC